MTSLRAILLLGVLSTLAAPAPAAIVLSGLGNQTQNFDFLANGTSNTTWNDDAATQTTNGSPGWYWERVGTSVGYDQTTPGSVLSEGSRYAFGVNPTPTDRAMGSFNTAAENSSAAWGAVFQNDSGQTVTGLTVTYTGEQWRQGGAGQQANPDKLIFSYQVSASNITTMNPSGGATPAGWTGVASLDFTQLQFADTNYALNGNTAANRTNLSATFTLSTPLDSSNFKFLALRWYDGDIGGQTDAGMGTDDLTVSFITAVPEASALLFGGLASCVIGLTLGVRSLRRRAAGNPKLTP
jgi:hypothetical protein